MSGTYLEIVEVLQIGYELCRQIGHTAIDAGEGRSYQSYNQRCQDNPINGHSAVLVFEKNFLCFAYSVLLAACGRSCPGMM
jgi:hypothetical protein